MFSQRINRFHWVMAAVTIMAAIPALQSNLYAAEAYPLAVVADGKGIIYVADRNLPGIWKIAEGKTSIYFRGSKKFGTPLNAVRCVAIDKNGRLLAGDSAARDVFRFDAEGQPQPLTKGNIGIPATIAVNKDGDLFVSDLETQRIWQVPAAGGEPKEFAVIPAVRGMTFDKEGVLWAVTTVKDQLRTFDTKGESQVILSGRPFEFPHHIVLDEKGTAYVTDNYSQGIWQIPAKGKPKLWKKGDPLKRPVGLCQLEDTLIVADQHARKVLQFDKDGKVKQLAGPEDFKIAD